MSSDDPKDNIPAMCSPSIITERIPGYPTSNQTFKYYMVPFGDKPGIYTNWCVFFKTFSFPISNLFLRDLASLVVNGTKEPPPRGFNDLQAAIKAWHFICRFKHKHQPTPSPTLLTPAAGFTYDPALNPGEMSEEKWEAAISRIGSSSTNETTSMPKSKTFTPSDSHISTSPAPSSYPIKKFPSITTKPSVVRASPDLSSILSALRSKPNAKARARSESPSKKSAPAVEDVEEVFSKMGCVSDSHHYVVRVGSSVRVYNTEWVIFLRSVHHSHCDNPRSEAHGAYRHLADQGHCVAFLNSDSFDLAVSFANGGI